MQGCPSVSLWTNLNALRRNEVTEPLDKKTLDALVVHIDRFGKDLTEWEKEFIISLVESPPDTYSAKQAAKIDLIYDKRC